MPVDPDIHLQRCGAPSKMLTNSSFVMSMLRIRIWLQPYRN